MMHWILKTTVN